MKLRDLRRSSRFVAVAGLLVAAFLRLLGATWRFRVEGSDPFATGRPFIGVLWHRNLFIAAHCWRDRGAIVPVSLSRDGEMIEAVLRQLGYGSSPRGSSSRGAAGLLRELIRRARDGRVVGILPDGPRGPARHVKPGVVATARATGLPVIPLGLSGWPAIRFGSWDRALLPLPFARVSCRYGAPIVVPKEAGEAEREAFRARIEMDLDRLTGEADASLALPALPEHGRTR